jgi:S1-C subfamily serine protease
MVKTADPMKPDEPSWALPPELRPDPHRLGFDLEAALNAMVRLSIEVPEEAYTAPLLGTERHGNGCVIGADGLVLTIGYLITEAQTIWITDHRGRSVPGHALGVDFASGLGLVLPAMPLDAPALARGASAAPAIGDELLVLGHGGIGHALTARLVERKTFAGYWEYVLDDALYTSPAHPHWSGSAVVDGRGRLIGVGSLLVQEPGPEGARHANMSVPVDPLEPILDELRTYGRPNRPPRPWLGFFVQEHQGRLLVGGLVMRGPAAQAGIEVGDDVQAVAGRPVKSLVELFRSIWAQGPAGTVIALTLRREGESREVRVRSIDRDSILWQPKGMN